MNDPEDGELARHLILTADHCGFGSFETPDGREVGVSDAHAMDVEHDTRMVDTNAAGEGDSGGPVYV